MDISIREGRGDSDFGGRMAKVTPLIVASFALVLSAVTLCCEPATSDRGGDESGTIVLQRMPDDTRPDHGGWTLRGNDEGFIAVSSSDARA